MVSSISVLESTDPTVLVNEVFPHNKYAGGEIVITGFLNCLDDFDCQCANIQRLAEGGEVGLILFYVGVYLPYVDQRLIDLADQPTEENLAALRAIEGMISVRAI